jgi:hypothetical protein
MSLSIIQLFRFYRSTSKHESRENASWFQIFFSKKKEFISAAAILLAWISFISRCLCRTFYSRFSQTWIWKTFNFTVSKFVWSWTLIVDSLRWEPTKKSSLFSRRNRRSGDKLRSHRNHQNQLLSSIWSSSPLKILTYLIEIDTNNSFHN